MSAPIPTPTRQRLNLHKLIASSPDAIQLQAALEGVFPKVVAEFTDDPIFPFLIRCCDHRARPRLLVHCRWSMTQDRWMYQVKPGA